MSLGLVPQLPASAGPLAELERRLLGLIEQLRLDNGVGYKVRRGTRGTVLEIERLAAGTGAQVRELTTVREGLDAVECVDENAATVYCLKPHGFRALGVTAYAVGGAAYGLVGGSVPAWIEYKHKFTLLQHGAYADAFRVIRKVKTVNADDYSDDGSDIGAVFSHISPFYTQIAAGGSVAGLPLTALRVPGVVIDTAALTVDAGGGATAEFLDLTPRAWEPMNVFVNRVETRFDAANSRHVAVFDGTGGTLFT